jgi:hypothetical protein
MKQLVYLVVPALVLAVCVPSAEAAKKKKTNAPSGAVAGTIVSVAKSDGTDTAAILTVKVEGGKKKAAASERKVELAKDTKFEALMMSKKQFGLRTASIDDLKEGEKVLIQTKEGNSNQADRIMVVQGGKKKKAAAN